MNVSRATSSFQLDFCIQSFGLLTRRRVEVAILLFDDAGEEIDRIRSAGF